MERISKAIHLGAKTFLSLEYRALFTMVGLLFILISVCHMIHLHAMSCHSIFTHHH
jgi:Na+/H+-translocating membrane pyrophosphatase